MALSPDVKHKPFVLAKNVPPSKRIWRKRPQKQSEFEAELRSRYLIGGSKFGFGHRRNFFHTQIENSLGGIDSADNTGDILIDALERAPDSNHNKVNKFLKIARF